MYRCHSFEEKLDVVSLILSGQGIDVLCRERHLDHHMVRSWLSRYQSSGESCLRSRSRYSRFSPQKKELIVRDFLKKSVPLPALCQRHGAIKCWVREVRKSGYGSLYAARRRGRPPQKDMGRPRKKRPEEMTELERLQYENMVLRAENALLKK